MKQDGHARLDLIDVSLFAPFYPMGKFGGLKLKNSFCTSSPQLTKRDKKLYIKKKAPVVIKVSKIIGHGEFKKNGITKSYQNLSCCTKSGKVLTDLTISPAISILIQSFISLKKKLLPLLETEYFCKWKFKKNIYIYILRVTIDPPNIICLVKSRQFILIIAQ